MRFLSIYKSAERGVPPSQEEMTKMGKLIEDEMKAGTLRSGRSGKKVTNPKQAIAIGLSEARKAGAHIPKKKARKR